MSMNPHPDMFGSSMVSRRPSRLLDGVAWAILALLLLAAQAAMAVTTGGHHTLLIKSDGSLWTWGWNSPGQLGDGTSNTNPVPTQVGSGFSTLAAGLRHSLAIKPDRTLWAWGYNAFGELGDGSQATQRSPVKIGSDYASVAGGEHHSVALKTDGSLWAWGYNADGRLGDGTTTDRTSPVNIGAGFAAVAAGYQHTLALKSDGTLWAWGNNDSGQLGDGTTTTRSSPVLIGSGFSFVAAGQSHSLALKTDGSLWAWGSNSLGQLGDGTTTSQNAPKQIGTDFIYMAAGSAHTVAIKTDGKLWAWGYNAFGQLGDGSTTNRSSPVLIDSNVVSVTAGYGHTLATKADGTLWAWGYNFYGQLGDGKSGLGAQQLKPVAITLAGGALDTQAPTIPTGLKATPVSSTQVNVEWTASTDSVGVSAYKLYRDGQLYAVLGNVVSFSNTAVTADKTRYSYALAACDAANNCSAQTTPVKTLVFTPSGLATPIETADQVVSSPSAALSVDSSGALVVEQAVPIVLRTGAPENALVKLATQQPLSVTSGTTTLQMTDQGAGAQLVVRTVNNQPQLEVAKGTVQIESPTSGNTISVVSSNQQTVGSIVTQTSNDKVVVAKTDTSSAVFVDSGKVNYQGPGQGATIIPVYQGENTQLASSGAINQLALGSLDGKKQVPGDPLPLTTLPRASDVKIPNLEGPLPRFDNAVTLQDILRDMIKGLVGDTAGVGQMDYHKETGVVVYKYPGGSYRLMAMGDVLVKLNQFSATNVSATAGGAYTLASRGIQMSLSGALGYFSDLQSAVKSVDAAGTLNLKPTGAIEVRLGGARYAVMPGATATEPSSPTLSIGFGTDGGNLVFRDHLGTLQTLYPAFLDVDTVTSLFKSAIPTIVLTNKPDGTVTADLAGQTYTLRPDYVVTDQAVAGHATESYWLDSGMIYLRNADKSAQGTRVQ